MLAAVKIERPRDVQRPPEINRKPACHYRRRSDANRTGPNPGVQPSGAKWVTVRCQMRTVRRQMGTVRRQLETAGSRLELVRCQTDTATRQL